MKLQVLSRLAQMLSRREPIDVTEFFTREFRLHDPNAPQIAAGHAGAREMIEGLLGWSQDMRIEIVDSLEQEDRIAIRWRLTGSDNGARKEAAIMAIYRFEGERIAEDWGMGARAPWPGEAHA